MVERVIVSRLVRFWPWLVASAAIHGLIVAIWLNEKPVTHSDRSVVLELVSIDLQTEMDSTQPTLKKPAAEKIQPQPATHTPAKKVIAHPSVTVASDHSSKFPARIKKQASTPTVNQQTSPAPELLARKTTHAPVPVLQQQPAHTVPAHQSSQQPHSAAIDRARLLVREHLEAFKYYPSSARRRGIEGLVEVGFTLIHDGAANQVSVLHGSGYAVLDHAALETVYRAQPFPIENGKYRFRLRFKRL